MPLSILLALVLHHGDREALMAMFSLIGQDQDYDDKSNQYLHNRIPTPERAEVLHTGPNGSW